MAADASTVRFFLLMFLSPHAHSLSHSHKHALQQTSGVVYLEFKGFERSKNTVSKVQTFATPPVRPPARPRARPFGMLLLSKFPHLAPLTESFIHSIHSIASFSAAGSIIVGPDSSDNEQLFREERPVQQSDQNRPKTAGGLN